MLSPDELNHRVFITTDGSRTCDERWVVSVCPGMVWGGLIQSNENP